MQDATLEVTLIIPAKNSTQTLEATVREAHRFLRQRYDPSFEILLVPNPSAGDLSDQTVLIAEKMAIELSSVRVCPHSGRVGKGAAIRTGFICSRGRWIFFTDADLPYDLSFFDHAIQKLKLGYDLVTGNRRLPSSSFHIPVHLLRLAYGRHRLGLAFNRLVRWILPISTTDTQAGIKALSRDFMKEVMLHQTCPGFLFDLELFLVAHAQGFKQIELPVVLYLNTEKSTVRILRECLVVGEWLTRIAFKNYRKDYGRAPHRTILSRYRQAKLTTRVFLFLRWVLTPYHQMASHLPRQGKILDLGCGHGLFALAAGMHSPSRQIFGIDHDSDRISLALHATQDLPNVWLEANTLTKPFCKQGRFQGISMIDVMHYLDPVNQESLLKEAFDSLEAGGKLLIREVDPNGGPASHWNRLYESVATRVGFTRTEKNSLHFRSRQEWEHLIERTGFKVSSRPCGSKLFADRLYICERP